ncbi:MAG TPA: hypothetical protein VM099_13185 [Gemmatimonadaceae bacterium]|nr:hypothetical protein [Gemmatimonadaceae bacterium]
MTRRFSGMWIEGDPVLSASSRETFGPYNHGVEVVNLFVTRENAAELTRRMVHTNPDIFSLDVDGTDYYLAQSLFANGFKPKMCVVEYNSAFGPDARLAIPYDRPRSAMLEPRSKLYYGCSVNGWRTAFSDWGYKFVTVDTNGVNAFFVDPAQFSMELIQQCTGLAFAENYAQRREFQVAWEGQWEKVRDLPFLEIEPRGESPQLANASVVQR